MGLNQLYFDHQILLIKAQQAATPVLRRAHERDAARIAERIQSKQLGLGAAAARSGEQPA